MHRYAGVTEMRRTFEEFLLAENGRASVGTSEYTLLVAVSGKPLEPRLRRDTSDGPCLLRRLLEVGTDAFVAVMPVVFHRDLQCGGQQICRTAACVSHSAHFPHPEALGHCG